MLDTFRGIRITDIIDILLLYLMSYYLIILLKETRTMQMLKGLLILLVASFMAGVLELHTINWILRNIWPIWVIAFVVLFQPELRQILVDIGQRRLRIHELFSGEDKLFDTLVETCKQMLKRKMGGLIILERDVGLKEYIETGTKLNSEVTTPILLTIFTPKTILHDGAVIINHSKIISAGCILPLSQKNDIDKELGMRHRAAIGITEETDAVALVISEDLRNISLSINGKITPVDTDNLKEMLIMYASKKL
ncbi:MAG: diadenylate cyclase CdaA [Candidatus Firestonebacteria bacterium]